MFTGIIKELGMVKGVTRSGLSAQIEIQARLGRDINLGDSISVNGVCLTVSNIVGDVFKLDAVAETLKKTTLINLRNREKVNLEPALTLNDPLGGHIVNGHIDGIALIKGKIKKGNSYVFEFSLPFELRDLFKYIVDKGPVAVDGISLTVVDAKRYGFTVSVIPFTIQNTTLSFKKIGDKVNIEVDVMAKYAEKITQNSKVKTQN
jgi:riboflavin synthase